LEDERLGQILRSVRRQVDMTQEGLAARAGVPVRDVIAVEDGRAGVVKVDRVRRMFLAVEGRARLTAWWGGAAADRLVDRRHAALVETALAILRRRGWEVATEVSFARYGERGSIDVLAVFRPTLTVVVGEVKASLGSLEETNRTLDVKERLAPIIAAERFGIRPRFVGRVLILPDDRTVRRIIDRHSTTMGVMYPARSREVRAWLHRPDRPLRGIWFLSELRTLQAIPVEPVPEVTNRRIPQP
jgi:hypothetical protein